MDDNKIKLELSKCETQRRVLATNNAADEERINAQAARIAVLQGENNQLVYENKQLSTKKSTSSKCTRELVQCKSIKNELSARINDITSEIGKLQDQLKNFKGVCEKDIGKMKVEYEKQQKEIFNRISELTVTLGNALENYSVESNLNESNFGKLVNQGYKYGCVREMNHFKKIYKNAHKKSKKNKK